LHGCNFSRFGGEIPKEPSVIAQEAQYRAWMIAALAGDGASYRLLLTALTRHLRGYFSRRLDPAAAEDAVQECLIAIHTHRATYDSALPFTAWMHGIARYKLLDEFRRVKRRAQVPLDEAPSLFAQDETEAATARRDVNILLARLPEAKRNLVRQVKLDGDSSAEVAARSGMSETAVKVSVHRAIKSMGDDARGHDENR
jgi:RNA polymerase sigma-70 factor (ECF subfamily)